MRPKKAPKETETLNMNVEPLMKWRPNETVCLQYLSSRLCKPNCTADHTYLLAPEKHFMQSGLTEHSNRESQTNQPHLSPTTPSQHGFNHSQPRSGSGSGLGSRSTSPGVPNGPLDVSELDQKLDRLNIENVTSESTSYRLAAGQRISEYENAPVMLSSKRQSPHPGPAFKVVNGQTPSPGVQLTDFPNEILTQVLSHLHPDSHASVALVSKRFYALVTTPYAWRAAFLRYFPGHDVLDAALKNNDQANGAKSSDRIWSETRFFTRLTALASWRSEYLLRTRLLRSVVRGKPGSVGSSIRSSEKPKRSSAILTYNSKLPWMISNIHAVFGDGKKDSKVIHGTRDMGIATYSDPTTGKIDRMGLDDDFAFQQLDEVFPTQKFWGLDDGHAAVPNVMDVSQPYGMLGGEGFPGGRVYFKANGALRGKYLGQDNLIIDMSPEIPKIPELIEAVSCVWIAKSSNVIQATQSMVGMMSGSTLGIVTTYALGDNFSGVRYSNGDMTARWALSPGVPIVDIKVDDNYSLRRKTLGRVWAVALNALGEVFYLREPPSPPHSKGKIDNMARDAWHNGRTVYWELIESTRRTAQPDEFDKNAVRGSYSPRSPANSMNLSKQQIVAEAKEIEKFFWYKPEHWRKACQGWDMQRKLEVDFAGGDDGAAGEAIFAITIGQAQGERASVRRYVRCGGLVKTPDVSGALTPVAPPVRPPQLNQTNGSSIFASNVESPVVEAARQPDNGVGVGKSAPQDLASAPFSLTSEEWRFTEYPLPIFPNTEISATAIDMSTFAVMAVFEDPLHSKSQTNTPNTPTSKNFTGEIPGRRARFLAVGTDSGAILVWNMRDGVSTNPVRVIQTDSPEISSLALSSLYLVHGGNDGLVQAWDPLASTQEPIRTLNAKSSGRIPRHILHSNPALQHTEFFAVRSISLDPDSTILRGVLAFGTFVRFWTYSSTNQLAGRKRRNRNNHSDVHSGGRMSRDKVNSFIAAETDELWRDQELRQRENERLRKRFGVGGIDGLSEEEALQYVQMISEETFGAEEERRRFGSSVDGSSSTTGSTDTLTTTTEPSVSGGFGDGGARKNLLQPVREDDEFEEQIQRAIRLSLLEGGGNGDGIVGGSGDSSPVDSGENSGEYEFEVKVKVVSKKGKNSKGKGRASLNGGGGNAWASGSGSGTASAGAGGTYQQQQPVDFVFSGEADFVGVDAEDDLALALRLSLEEEEARQRRAKQEEEDALVARGMAEDEFPILEVKGKGKGRAV
ncbi:putative F-box/WD repeat-containing protein POF10 [Podospora fimiseda]|uniref:F-box/WD repeat-containing protein POF10 n=1 Tax=Podospora fimiseda TaxID=252190 RepID=A0AAN7BV92_9PEZI|nr:putative F-box/WD repeat-containing protein POF10 [Podospora fimiseda]